MPCGCESFLFVFQLRELEKKSEVQSLRHEELGLEVSAMKKQSKTRAWIDASPEGTVTPGMFTASIALIYALCENEGASHYFVTMDDCRKSHLHAIDGITPYIAELTSLTAVMVAFMAQYQDNVGRSVFFVAASLAGQARGQFYQKINDGCYYFSSIKMTASFTNAREK